MYIYKIYNLYIYICFKVVQVSQSSALVLCLILCWSTLYRQLRRWNRLELFMPGFLRSGSSQIPIPRFCPISQSNFYFVESSILVLVKTQFLDGQTIVFFVCFFCMFCMFLLLQTPHQLVLVCANFRDLHHGDSCAKCFLVIAKSSMKIADPIPHFVG